jgi:hypothetical protein
LKIVRDAARRRGNSRVLELLEDEAALAAASEGN